MLGKFLPPELLNKQKSVWDSSLPISIQTSPAPDFTNYRDPPQEISDTTDEDEPEETLDDPMEIYFVKKEDEEAPTSIATVRCKIKNLKIPAAILDSGAECSIMSHDIAKRLGLKIDESEKYDLSGAATKTTESIGMTPELSIAFAPRCILHEKFVVVHYGKKPLLAFSNPFIKKHKCIMDWDKDELKIPLNGKEFIIPVTMHRVTNKVEAEVNCVNKDTDLLSSDSDRDEELKKSCVNLRNVESSHKMKREEELEQLLSTSTQSLYTIPLSYNNLLSRVGITGSNEL